MRGIRRRIGISGEMGVRINRVQAVVWLRVDIARLSAVHGCLVTIGPGIEYSLQSTVAL